jgi:glycosyltransferase involved in cell wall biosynthesis
MRVMYLSASGELGGAERSLLDMAASIRAARPSWNLGLVAGSDGPLIGRAAALGVAAAVVPFPPALSRLGEAGAGAPAARVWRLGSQLARAVLPVARYRAALRAAVAAFGPDVIHSNGLKTHLLGAWTRPSGAALVWHLHDYIGSRPLTAWLLRRNLRACAAVIANSSSVAADAAAALGAAVPIVPVLNAVDLERFTPAGDALDLDALAGLPAAPAGVIRVGLLGTLGRWKGHATFLDALARLPPGLPVRGYIIGGALYQTDRSQHSLAELRARAVALGLDGRIGFTGFVADPERALRALDVVVHASTAPEPFGLVIAEAMACGRAVIAADAGGARELFDAGVDALPHAPGSAESLAARIAALAASPEWRQQLGQAGRRTAERRFDRHRLATELLPVYARARADRQA